MLYFKNWKISQSTEGLSCLFWKTSIWKWSQDLGSYRNGFESQGSYLLCASYPRNLSIPQLQNESNGNFIAGDSCRVKWRQIYENSQGMTDRTIVSSTWTVQLIQKYPFLWIQNVWIEIKYTIPRKWKYLVSCVGGKTQDLSSNS